MMSKLRRKIDLYFFLLILFLFFVTVFILTFFNLNSFELSDYLLISLLFLLILISYFKGYIFGNIFAIIIIFVYGSYWFYFNLIVPINPVLNISYKIYLWLIIFPLAAFLTGNFAHIINELQKKNSELEEKINQLSTLDPETELENEKQFFLELEQELSYCSRYKSPLTLMLIEIKYYKELQTIMRKEKLNHILKMFVQVINESTRLEDMKYRIDEHIFAVIFPNTQKNGVFIVKDRIKSELKGLSIREKIKKEKISLEVRIGIGEYNEEINGPFAFKDLVEQELKFDV